MKLTDLHKEILAICVDDYAAFGLITKRISKDVYYLDPLPTWARRKTIDLLRDLLKHGLIIAGHLGGPNEPEFTEISLTVDEIVAFIEAEWDKLNRTPDIGDICWFNATVAGEQVSKEL